MSRINSSIYNDEIIYAFEVDNDYENFKRDKFNCPDCLVKVQFNRGIKQSDPHFKNWPKIEHHPQCETLKIQILHKNNDNEHIKTLTSTILPKATRLINLSSNPQKQKIVNRYLGERSKKFLNSLISLNMADLQNLFIRTEDKRKVLILDLIKRQDEIIDQLDSTNESFICVLKGFLTTGIQVGSSIRIPLTSGGVYKNKNKFDLFMPHSFTQKNVGKFETIENSLIYCYGLAEKNQYGYKMDLYSITHQIVKIPQP